MKTLKRYSPIERERAVRLVFDLQQAQPAQPGTHTLHISVEPGWYDRSFLEIQSPNSASLW
jgi:hypothetical protein